MKYILSSLLFIFTLNANALLYWTEQTAISVEYKKVRTTIEVASDSAPIITHKDMFYAVVKINNGTLNVTLPSGIGYGKYAYIPEPYFVNLASIKVYKRQGVTTPTYAVEFDGRMIESTEVKFSGDN